MLPGLAAAAAASVVLLSGRWYLEELSELVDRAGALAVYAMTLAVWPGLLAVLLYRTVTFTYRLTDRMVLIDRGSLFRPEPPVSLAEIAAVTVGSRWLGRRLGVGSVVLTTAAGREVRLTGVRDPAGFADAIRKAVSASVTRGHGEGK
jgi:membrane protein YdbS with pleckstrin-like domain